MSRKHVESHYGAYIVGSRRDPETGERGTLVQTDWDYPATASDLGWNMRRVQVRKYGEYCHESDHAEDFSDGSGFKAQLRVIVLKRAPKRGTGCDHRGTDGTVTCPDCGITASAFIGAAGEYLDSLC